MFRYVYKYIMRHLIYTDWEQGVIKWCIYNKFNSLLLPWKVKEVLWGILLFQSYMQIYSNWTQVAVWIFLVSSSIARILFILQIIFHVLNCEKQSLNLMIVVSSDRVTHKHILIHVYMHTRTHTHTYTDTCTQVYIHSDTYTHVCTYNVCRILHSIIW